MKSNGASQGHGSRFDGVMKYLNAVYRDKNLPVPSFSKSSLQGDTSVEMNQRNSLLQGEDLVRNDSGDLLMERVGQPDKGRSVSNLRQANLQMSQLLKNEINFSKETVERVKRGHSIFDLDIVQEAQKNSKSVVIRKQGFEQQLEHFLNLSVAETTYVPQAYNDKARNEVIDLIRNSPQKTL